MSVIYNRVAGQSVDRLAALSDGIFGVAMTLLLLDLRTPVKALVHNESDLIRELVILSPNLLVYLMSFITLGIFWVGQQTQLNHLQRSDRNLTWLHLAFLFSVTLLPFSTRLLISFIDYRLAFLTYWANFALLGGTIYAAWRLANRSGLVKPEVSDETRTAIGRRIVSAQLLYSFAVLLCVIST